MTDLVKLNYGSFILFLIILLICLINAQRYDFSEGSANLNINNPCTDGAIGTWADELATTYPGGPTSGFIFTSNDPTSASCLDTTDFLDIKRNSKLHIQFYKDYKESWDNFYVRLVNENSEQFEWLRISGKTDYEGWHEFSTHLPRRYKPGKYKIQVWDDSSTNAIVSLRYFEISDKDLPETTLEPIDSTSTSSLTDLTSETPTGTTVSTHPTVAPPNTGFIFSWWSLLIGLALGVLLTSIMFCLMTWCWWLACVRWRSRSEQSHDDPEILPRLKVVSTPGSLKDPHHQATAEIHT